MAAVVVVDNYDLFTWNLVHLIGPLGAARSGSCATTRRRREALLAEAPDAIVLSPGPCTPNEAGICLEVIRDCGAQRADPRRLPRHAGDRPGLRRRGGARAGADARQGLDRVAHTAAASSAASTARFKATRYHSLVVAPRHLPARPRGHGREPTTGSSWGSPHRDLPIHGVQFHPESIASEHGERILRELPRSRRGVEPGKA